MKKDFPIFDCDSHIVEPPAIWDEYVPANVRAWVKTQFHFHTDTDVLLINGRAVPASRERSNASRERSSSASNSFISRAASARSSRSRFRAWSNRESAVFPSARPRMSVTPPGG